MTHQFTPEEIEGFLTFLLESGANKRCSNVYQTITQLQDNLNSANTILDDIGLVMEQHGYVHMTNGKGIASLLDKLDGYQRKIVPNFEAWWKTEKTRPPYTNPKAIAKSAWDHLLNHFTTKGN